MNGAEDYTYGQKGDDTPCWQARRDSDGKVDCPELARYFACRNCPRYLAAGRALLEREATPEFLRENTADIASPKPQKNRAALSLNVMRIGREWLALPTRCFSEVLQPVRVRRLPHSSNPVLLGLCCIRGGILPCVSLERLLGIDADEAACAADESRARFCVIGDAEGEWAFPAREVAGIIRIDAGTTQELPSTLSRSLQLFASGLLVHEGRHIGLLDEHMVLHALKRSIR